MSGMTTGAEAARRSSGLRVPATGYRDALQRVAWKGAFPQNRCSVIVRGRAPSAIRIPIVAHAGKSPSPDDHRVACMTWKPVCARRRWSRCAHDIGRISSVCGPVIEPHYSRPLLIRSRRYSAARIPDCPAPSMNPWKLWKLSVLARECEIPGRLAEPALHRGEVARLVAGVAPLRI